MGHGVGRLPGPVPPIAAASINYISTGVAPWVPTVAERTAAINQGAVYAQALGDHRAAAIAAGRPMPAPFPEVVGGVGPHAPGGAVVGAHFLPPPPMQIRARLLHGAPGAMADLYRVDAWVWAATAAGIEEVRDQREFAVVAKALPLLNQGKTAQASDLMVQRIREILVAKRPGGSWEKGELVSLLPSTQASSAPLPDGALGL